MAPNVLRHHQGVGAGIHREVLVGDSRREIIDNETLCSDSRRIKGVLSAVRVVVYQDIYRAKCSCASFENRAGASRTSKVDLGGRRGPATFQHCPDYVIRGLLLLCPV
jgi:hypothetical protein